MAIHLRRPDAAGLETLLARCSTDTLTYQPVGVSMDTRIDTNLRRGRWETALGAHSSFDRACAALRAWEVHRGAGLSVLASGDLTVGTNVAMAAPLPVGFVEVTCRIVSVVEEPGVYGFAYGTLSVHPERGEESFLLRQAPDGSVRFTVEAASTPVLPLARLAPPATHFLQGRACRRYLAAMRRSVEAAKP